ncbi:MAG: hypothetical protein OEY52_02525 [Gammaproteobacteria bacterium]|nr:hypothetical protein [Gammaproteobacteria bacterium]
MNLTKLKVFLLITVFSSMTACGGGDSSSTNNTNTVDNRPQGEQIVGTWLSPCTSIHFDNGDPTVHFRNTLTFNADKSMVMTIRNYQTRDCINLATTGNWITEVLGVYQVGGEATDSEGKTATELDVTYSKLKINNELTPTDINSVNLVVFRVEGSRFFTHDLNYQGNNPFIRFDYIPGFYYYTRQ